jgi:transglutaminase-like putative cysteine protease
MVLDQGTYEIIRAITYLIGVPVIIALCVSIARRLKAIKARVAEVRAEEAQNARNPYAQMAALYAQEEARETIKQARRGKVK